MDLWRVLLWSVVTFGMVAALYGLHRFCLWLENRGWLYYKHKKPGSSQGSCLLALQQALEPQVQHVLQLKEQKRHHAEEAAPGEGTSPETTDHPEPA